MDASRYIRNRIYIEKDHQQLIKTYRILLAGAGIGSVIAEVLLRIGFENVVIIDYDIVDISNLNRQNYINAQVGKSKVKSLKSRLLAINPNAKIIIYDCELNRDNMHELLKGISVAINALDFSSAIPFEFDEYCKNIGIPVIHPYNIGWGGLVTVFSPNGKTLTSLSKNYVGFEVKMVEHALKSLKSKTKGKHWVETILEKYLEEDAIFPPPQLSIGSNILAGQCASIVYRLAINQPVKFFPKFYFYSIFDDNY